MFPPCSLHVPATKYNPVAHMTFEFVQDKWHAAIYIYIYIYIYVYIYIWRCAIRTLHRKYTKVDMKRHGVVFCGGNMEGT